MANIIEAAVKDIILAWMVRKQVLLSQSSVDDLTKAIVKGISDEE